MMEKYSHVTGMTLLTADEHRALLADAGFINVQVFENHDKGWIAALGTKQPAPVKTPPCRSANSPLIGLFPRNVRGMRES